MSLRMPRLLLVDDESEIIDLCAHVLQRRYLVLKTTSPQEALALMESSHTMIDLVVCDYSMPEMSGEDFLEEVRSRKITTPILLYSGQIVDLKRQQLDKFVKVLSKPFGREQLLFEIGSVIRDLGLKSGKKKGEEYESA